MERVFTYPGQIPLDTDLLSTNRNTLIALGYALQAVLGTTTSVDGLACTPGRRRLSLGVQVAPGVIHSLQNIDGSAYGALPADTAHQIVKQGLLLDAMTLATPAPVTAGQSAIYLIQAAYADQDANPVVLPYYNAANPSQGYAGPNNSGTAQNTVRKGLCLVSAKAGVAATSPTVPAPDAGYVGLYTVTVSNGQSSVSAGNITRVVTAPVIAEKLADKISKASADFYYGPQHGQCRLGLSGGSLVLRPYNGNRLVDGSMTAIPSAGVSLPPAGLTPGTAYWIYAAVVGGNLALEASTTGHVTHANGVEVKSGDASRTLVGAAVPVAGPAFSATSPNQQVATWFNRRLLDLNSPLSPAVITNTAPSELALGARSVFWSWGDEAVSASASAVVSNNTGGQACYLHLTLDMSTQFGRTGQFLSAAAGQAGYVSAPGTGGVAEGLHTLSPYGYVSGSTGTYGGVSVIGTFRA